MTEEFKEVEVKTDTDENRDMDTDGTDDEEMSGTPSTADSLIPLQQHLTHIDQHFPPPNKPTHPESFHSVGQKRRRLNEPESATVKSTQTAASLYRDALHFIYQFLKLREFMRMCIINKTYYLAGQLMKSRNDYLDWMQGPVCLLVQSPLRHHITNLDLRYQDLDSNGLFLLHYRMGHLLELRMCIKLNNPDAPASSFILPQQLRVLTVEFELGDDDNDSEDDARTYLLGCLKQIVLHSRCLVKLDVDFPCEIDCPHELRTMSNLTDITLPRQIDLAQQIDLIKSLPMIRCWNSTQVFSIEDIRRLADGLVSPCLEDIGELSNVDEEMANELIRISTLTKLDLQPLALSDPTKLLPHFPRLSILWLACGESVHANHLAAALSACKSLTEVILKHTKLTSHNMCQFLSHLNSLVKLDLVDCVDLVSLRFLTTARESLTNLRRFSIHGSTGMPIKEYHHLRSISRSLESFTIRESFVGRFDPLTIGRWTPGSEEFCVEEWPKLKKIQISPR